MAFNPFHKFRKHQRTLIAALAIFCMFMFVFSIGASSGGDVLSFLTHAFGVGRSSKVQAVAQLYGKDVTETDLITLNNQRMLAQSFLMQAINRAALSRRDELREQHKDIAKNLPPESLDKILENVINQDREFRELMAANMSPLFSSYSPDPNDLLNFMIWRHQADQLGIALTKTDVWKLIQRLTNNRFKTKDSATIEAMLLRNPQFKGMNSDTLIQALANEFRVQMAQLALVGDEPFMPRSFQAFQLMQMFGMPKNRPLGDAPATPTPQQFWDFYRQQCATIDIGLLPVRVDDFLAKVTEKPTEKDLKALYDKYKDQESTPESREPGFKRPKRIQVQWVGGKVDAPEARKEVERINELASALLTVGAGGGLVLNGAPAAVNLTLPGWSERSLMADYADRLGKGFYHNRPWTEPWIYEGRRLHVSLLYRPENVAGMVGQALGLAGQAPTGIPAVGGAGAFEAPPTVREMEKKTQIGSTIVADALAAPWTAAAAAHYAASIDDYEPFAFVKPRLAQDTLDEALRKRLKNTLKQVQEAIEQPQTAPSQVGAIIGLAVAGAPGSPMTSPAVALTVSATAKGLPALREPMVAELVKKYQLETGKTTELRDQHRNRISDDPGLKPLKEAFEKSPLGKPTARETDPFGNLFFGFSSGDPFKGHLMPEFLGSTEDKQFLWWKTEEQAAEKVPFDTVRADVEKAWRLLKARELAKKEAEAIEKKAKETKGDVRLLTDLAAKDKTKLILLDPLARQKREKTTLASADYTYVGPKLSKDKVSDLGKDEGANLARDLLKLRDKPKGETEIVNGSTEAEYYVAVLLGEPKDPPMGDFLEAYQNSAVGAKKTDPLFGEYLREQQMKYRRDLIERLRADAKLEIVNKEGMGKLSNQGLPED